MDRCQLYLVSPPQIADLAGFTDTLASSLDAGPVAAFQLRLKGPVDPEAGELSSVNDDVIRATVEALREPVQSRGVAFILNDRPDLAAALDCDGVHIGQDDAPYGEARAALGAKRTVGVTCHNSRHLAMEAAEAGADYVAFGAFFPTATKAPKTQADITLIEWWAEVFTTPCVAIGGITPENCKAVAEAGADFVAASASVWDAPDGPAEAVKRFTSALDAAAEARAAAQV